MPQSIAQRRDAARELAKKLFRDTNTTANLNWDDLTAAVGAIDTFMDTAINGGQTLRQRLVAAMPEPFRSNTNAQQKAMALVVWALKEVGLI